MAEATGMVGSLVGAGSVIVRGLRAAAAFNYQIVTVIINGISDCLTLMTTISSTLMTALGSILRYLAEVFAEFGNVMNAVVKLGSTILKLLFHIIGLAISGIVYVGDGIVTLMSAWLRSLLLALGRLGSYLSESWQSIKTAVSDVAPEYVDSISTAVNRIWIYVSTTLQHSAKVFAATTGAILGTAYDSLSMLFKDFLEVSSIWCKYIYDVTLHSTWKAVLALQHGLTQAAIVFQKHISVDPYTLLFLATVMFIFTKFMLDYMNKRDMIFPFPGYTRQTRIRIRGDGDHLYAVDSSDDDFHDQDEEEDEIEFRDGIEIEIEEHEGSVGRDDDEVTISTDDDFNDSDSSRSTVEEFEVASEESDTDTSEGGTSVEIQLPPAGAYNLRVRKKSPGPSTSSASSGEKINENDEVSGASSAIEDEESESLMRKCVVCQDQPKTVLVLPCKHMCLCIDCAHTIATSRNRARRVCPLCRGRIQTVMNVYL